ncbi:MAG: DUF4242 domain-containing protein [Euryarchaeota archaeon]|nr:DUF4242 domain-containing protein [Euryarchaeota archaeon]
MARFLIERHIPGIEKMGPAELKAVARKSNNVLAELGSTIRWEHSFILNGKTFCVYEAPDEELIREHARLSGFPCNSILPVAGLLDPSMGE